jgi:hypothetical protein
MTLVRTDVSEEHIAPIMRVKRIGVLGTLAVTTNRSMLGAIRSSETAVHTRATGCNIPEDGILHSHRRENLKYYMDMF